MTKTYRGYTLEFTPAGVEIYDATGDHVDTVDTVTAAFNEIDHWVDQSSN